MDARHEHGKEVLSHARLILLSAFWLGYQLFFSFATLIWLPAEVGRIYDTDFRFTALGILVGVGGVVYLFVAPYFGAKSDQYSGYLSHKFGKRVPFLILGVIGMAGSTLILAGLSYFDLFPIIVCGWALVMFFAGLIQAPYNAVIPDNVLREQYGAASGWMTAMIMLGNVGGGVLGYFLERVGLMKAIFTVTTCLLLSLIFACFYNHRADGYHLSKPKRKPEETVCGFISAFFWTIFKPFASPDFTWFFLSRCLMGMGYSTIQQFLLYFMDDVVRKPYVLSSGPIGNYSLIVPDEKAATSLFLIVMLGTGFFSALLGGVLSDRIGRRTIVYVAGALQILAVVFCLIPFFQSFQLILVMGAIFGLGYGAYQSVHFALATEILPNALEYGKDMGIWNLSGGIPSTFAPLLSGLLLHLLGKIGQNNQLGYTVVFGLSIVWFLIGTALVAKIRLYNRNKGQALDSFFSTINAQADHDPSDEFGLSDIDRYNQDMQLSSDSSGESEGASGSSQGYVESGNMALDSFVSGSLDINEISFGSDDDN